MTLRWRLQSLLPASMNRAMRRHLFRARDSKRKVLTRKARFLRLNATLLLVVLAGAFRSSHQKSRQGLFTTLHHEERIDPLKIASTVMLATVCTSEDLNTQLIARISKKGRASLHCLLIQISNSIGRIAILPRTTPHSTQQTYVGSK